MSNPRLCLVPRLSGVGGMVSFEQKLAQGLAARGIEVCYSLDDWPYRAVLVIGGTHELVRLWQVRRKGALIVQRLDGMNWMHRRLKTGTRHFIRAEYGNLVLAAIRSRLADRIVYQSQFSRNWWERVRGRVPRPQRVIYNGVDLSLYSPLGPGEPPPDRVRLLLVEGSLSGGYEQGLDTAVQLAEGLQDRTGRPVELVIAGRVAPDLQEKWRQRAKTGLHFAGLIRPDQIPQLDRTAHLLFSADLNAACPNSVIEALACGLPVLAYDTGALPELVVGNAGRIAPYGGDPWLLEPADLPTLVQSGEEILQDQAIFRHGARARAEQAFNLDAMVDAYREILLDS